MNTKCREHKLAPSFNIREFVQASSESRMSTRGQAASGGLCKSVACSAWGMCLKSDL